MENIAVFNSKHIGELQPTLRPEMAIETRHFNISLYLKKTVFDQGKDQRFTETDEYIAFRDTVLEKDLNN